MNAWVDGLTAFIGAHPHWAGVFVFLIAATEAVVVIGYIIPGTAILLTVGGIAGLGHLPLLPILAWGAAGAVVGDGFSYWLGHRYHEDLLRRWPFSRYPDLIVRGEAFFQRHGAKSVFLGRFVPLLKPIIPTLAGILGMPPARFYVSNIVSALFWSPAHILPGVLVGASLGLLHGISARLVVVVLGALVAAVLLVWGMRIALARVAPLLNRAHRRVYESALARPGTLAARLASPFDPDHPGLPALVASLLLLVAAALALVGVVEDVVSGDSLLQADHAIGNLLGGLRNAWSDPVMVAVTAMGDVAVVIPLAASVLAWLAAVRAWRLAGAVAVALATAGVAVVALKALARTPFPETMDAGVDAFAFPSGHTTMATVLFGLAAWLAAGGAGLRGRVLAYAASFGWVLVIAFSRIHLGAQWPSDVLAGLLLGTLVCATVAVLFRNERRERLHPVGFALVFAGVLVSAGAAHLLGTYDTQLARYMPTTDTLTLSARQWRDGAWRNLPARRIDLAGESEEPLSVQWLGSAATLETTLLRGDWQHPPPGTLANLAGFLKPDTALSALPTLPALHDGRKPVLMLVRDGDTPRERWVLRAWPTSLAVTTDGHRSPLLVVAVTRQYERHPGGMLTLPRVGRDEPAPAFLTSVVGGRERRAPDGRGVVLAGEHDSGARVAPDPRQDNGALSSRFQSGRSNASARTTAVAPAPPRVPNGAPGHSARASQS